MKKTYKAPATAGKLKIEGVGSFNVDAMKGIRKGAILEMHPELTTEQHETIWKAVSKGEMPEQSSEENQAP